jgi:phosphopantothenoylcysteine decarboxylase/phosphopantothenate--cysteine ligase
MGYAVALACAEAGAKVTLVSGPCELPVPEGVEVVRVETALQMRAALKKAFPRCQAFVSAAAVSDFRPESAAPAKRKKDGKAQPLRLVPNPDILLELSRAKGSRVLVGFAAETGDLLKNGQAKLKAKKLDLLVANLVGKPGTGFASEDNEVTLLKPGREPEPLPRQGKGGIGRRLALELADLLGKR